MIKQILEKEVDFMDALMKFVLFINVRKYFSYEKRNSSFPCSIKDVHLK